MDNDTLILALIAIREQAKTPEEAAEAMQAVMEEYGAGDGTD